jgi:hypothetical protein
LRRHSLPALWHLLSLDAPTVAALWFTLAARTAHLSLQATDVAALALGTWMLYAIDRMLDAWHGAIHLQEERHRFHGANHGSFLAALVCSVPVLLVLLRYMEPRLLHAYLVLGLALAAYFTLIHTRSFAHRIPKELAVGVIFVAAIFMPEFLSGIFMPEFLAGAYMLLPAICFGALCWLNCVLIYWREHVALHEAHWSTRLAIRHMTLLLGTITATALILFFTDGASRLSASIVLSAAAMLALHRLRFRMARLPFRIATDAALLTPLLFLTGCTLVR